MPLKNDATLPAEKSFPLIPAEVYEAVIDDIEEETKPSIFKNPDGSPQEDQTQYKVKFVLKEPGAYLDAWLTAWVNPSLRSSTKSKRPTLPQLLHAALGETFGPEDREKVTGALLNTLIGAKIRLTTQIEKSKSTGKEYAVVVAFLPSKVG